MNTEKMEKILDLMKQDIRADEDALYSLQQQITELGEQIATKKRALERYEEDMEGVQNPGAAFPNIREAIAELG